MDASVEGSERRVANGLLLVGLAVLVGLLQMPYARPTAALLPLAGAAVVVFAKPMGNRLLSFGLLLMSALLLVAWWRFPVFFPMLDVLVAIILLVAGVLKHRGKW